ncbi:Benzaldehyde dehydrogenase [NAD(+)] [Pseudovibrio axinellae]|uniref:Benzaldehyde dehydrogenase [NAD(+)] n=1 Tax=Pseudovibrio axinellae TaxID=989403 RepID=A0A165YMG3_9HYPH|nr:phenylacetic acid degradation protein PaaN [Pseudovibrio axinellae]KZL18984.1 Benzaldehyde dehydrogenase [NAD(+)] [Pseudovibrio axinellae]SEP85139.1 phenylacetic acid degradation protein paaN [Pseudovibrio axinellae]
MVQFFEAHKDTLFQAVKTSKARDYWSAYPEIASGKIYGETAKDDQAAEFEALMDKPFALGQPTNGNWVGAETSPYGKALGVTYEDASVEDVIAASKAAGKSWASASVEDRVGVALEMLNRVNKKSFLIANAVMHTSGQAFMMAFQAGGPHAQDRGLEAVAYAYDAMTQTPKEVTWTKPQGKHDPIVLDKKFRVVPRGVALVIGCATFPTWNTYPGMFASMVTGNSVIIKPHPMAILPMAITIQIGREVLKEAGFDPNVLMLAADTADNPKTKGFVSSEEVNIIDFTGSNTFGQWVRDNAGNAQVYTEEAGVNAITIHSTDNLRGMASNIAFSLSLYSGQMCTTPQNIFVPRDGIETNDGKKSFEEVAEAIKVSLDKLLGDPARAAAILGAVQNPTTLDRIFAAGKLGKLIRSSEPVEGMNGARSATPTVVAVDSKNEEAYMQERFGPISFIIACDDIDDAIARAAGSAKSHGAITAALYSTSEDVIDKAVDAYAWAGAPLSVNLTGNIYVNQSAAYSDFHVTGANPAGNASLTDGAYVANRFRIATVRRQAAVG